MKEIGGYLEFENLGGREYHPGCLKLNLGRCAVSWFLTGVGCRTLYFPHFICASVTDAVISAGIEIIRYRIRPDFRPEEADLPASLGEDEWLFIDNAYGQLTNTELASYRSRYERILVDNTHAFFQKPADGVPTLYSVRKFLGVTDGAYLYPGRDLAAPEKEDYSHDRFAHILGRYEKDAGTFYSQMLNNAHSYKGASAAKMSRLTENILGGLDYDRIASARMDNYLTLKHYLGSYNPLETEGILRVPDTGPFVYPMLVKDGPAVRRKLAKKKIFVPTYWSDLITDAPKGSVEQNYAADILALPCDQRYDADDMRTVAEAVLEEIGTDMEKTEKTLLILGALEEFVPLVKLASEKKIRTVVVDGNPGAPAKAESLRLGGAAYDADIRDTEKVAEIAAKEHVDAVTTAYSDLLLECMVKIADRASLPCHLVPGQLPWYRDKDITNRTCEELGIGTTKSVLLEPGFDDSELDGFEFPMIIKPLDMYGSRGLRIVRSIPEIRSHLDACLAASHRPEILAEEYNDEYEFNMQCWVRNGVVRVLGIADREKTSHDPEDIPLSTRNIYPSRLIDRVYGPALDALTRYIGRTGQKEGPLSMQFFWGPKKGFMVGEIAARYLGYEHELIEFTTGVSVEEILLAGAFDTKKLDELLDSCDPFAKNSAAVIYFHARDGIVRDLSSALAILARKDVQYGKIFYSEGDRIGSPQTMPYAARFYIIADSREEIDARTEEIISEMALRDADGCDLLYPNQIGTYE